ncbi:hypothetical protein PVAND_003061 [Polypedilum vanderplanki]|uniref:DUF3105 domain-containing protein n=1 Tax=Polypedilum vanderplanki TaxID=319348 RepID=A0A9J6BTE3_POLVA|nr:hypothetical protein PVAND_003061 [Polypedilum vanderplanki]
MNIPVTLLILAIFSSILAKEEPWNGKWFPNNPEESATASENTTESTEKWTGKWFPSNPNEEHKSVEKTSDYETKPVKEQNESWKGNWFPENPQKSTSNEKATNNAIQTEYKENTFEYDRIMGIANSECDDGETNLKNDFDPSNADHVKVYTCLEANYRPNANLEPIETIYEVPKFYTPVHKCMNETITYDQHIPTLGFHRPLWPAYGEYTYVPPQRWLHSLEHGAIVALYDPCANKSEIYKLKNLLKKCLYRHIITPYKLSSKRPLALAAWAVSLEMSIFDETLAKEFIKKYAKTGPEKVSRQGQYKKMLIEEAKFVTDENDREICPDKSVLM